MKFKILLFSSLSIFFFSFLYKSQLNDSSIQELLIQLGEEPPLHYLSQVDSQKVQTGYELITIGRSRNPKGKKSKRISKHFVCIDCHNTVIDYEFDESKIFTSIEKLKTSNTPFLPGSTFKGMVNRKTWYNDDYQDKYGDLATSSKDTLENAIQLCATVCSQGRRLDNWEMEVIMHYLWSNELHLSDLNTKADFTPNDNATSNTEKLALLNNSYLSAYSAKFLPPLPVAERKNGANGNIEEGQYIYDKSCLTCHNSKKGPAKFKLDKSRLTFKMLTKNLDKEHSGSIYNIVRTGTHPNPEYRPYMPLFTEQKLSNDQLESLVAYIVKQAE